MCRASGIVASGAAPWSKERNATILSRRSVFAADGAWLVSNRYARAFDFYITPIQMVAAVMVRL